MILQSLTDYYNLLTQDENSGISAKGYCESNVAYALVLSKSGEILNFVPTMQTVKRGKKDIEISQKMIIPQQKNKTSGVSSNFLCENCSYVFGIYKPDLKLDEEKQAKEAMKIKRCFEAFAKLHHDILDDVDCDEAKALLAFVDNWDIEQAYENEILKPYINNLLKSGNIVFMLDGKISYIHQNQQICDAWERSINNDSSSEEKSQCLVTGKLSEIARLHPKIKGVYNAQTMGVSLVSFNAKAYESYEKEQGDNAPVGKDAAFAYGTALNYLLSNQNNNLHFGNTTMVFWAKNKNKLLDKMAKSFFDIPDSPQETQPDEYEKNAEVEKDISYYLKAVMQGKWYEIENEIDKNTDFYIFGMSPNAARISVRFFIHNSYGDFAQKIKNHYDDLKIEKEYPNEKEYLTLWIMLNETVSQNSKDKSPMPLIIDSVLRAILMGTAYPQLLYTQILLRIKAESEVGYAKASILKACLIRKNYKDKGALTVGLNEECNDKAYILGR
ncbi:MAG: type I-C CRISPR-associated protein Cas8c/Csd1, partial [Oscillospiraceae bacterium]